jgi:hypothetical protein
MGPLLILAGVALAVGFGWRSLRREHSRVVSALKDAQSAVSKRAPVTLEKDPKTGVYRAPRDR